MDSVDDILRNELDAAISDAADGEPTGRLYRGTVRLRKIYFTVGAGICLFYIILALIAVIIDSITAAICFIPIALPGAALLRMHKNFRIVFDEDSFTYTDYSGHSEKWFFFEVMAFEEAENRFIIYLPDRDIEIPARCYFINEFLQNMPQWTKDNTPPPMPQKRTLRSKKPHR